MQTIKIPFSIKFYFFFALMWIILSLLWMDYWYWYFWIYAIYSWIISLSLSIIQSILLFKYFKDPKQYSNINIIFIIIMLLIYTWLTMYNWLYLLLIMIYHLVFLINFIQYKRFLNLEEWEKKDKFIKYTDKNQYKNTFILYWIIILSLIIFYFSYYSVPAVNFKHINDNYFENTHKYKDILDEENWFKTMLEYWKHRKKLEYVEDLEIKKYFSNNLEWIKEIELNIEKVKKIDNLRLWIDEIIKKKAIIYKIDDNYFSLQWISMMARETIHNVLYYLENWDEEKAINYLIDNYRFWNMITNSYWTLVNFIVWTVVQDITITELNYIIDNYTLSKKTLINIKDNIKNLDDISNSYKNAINYDYHYMSNLEKNNTELFNVKWSLIFTTKDYYHKGFKNQYYSYSIWEKNYCDKLRGNKIQLFLKKDTFSNIMLTIACITLDWYEKDIENTITNEQKLLEKIDKLLKIIH